MRKLALKIIEAILVEALGIEEKEMRELFEEGWQSMRMNYYPPCPQPELVNGLSPHSDAIGLTILLQVNQVDQGLQIKKDDTIGCQSLFSLMLLQSTSVICWR